MAKKASRKRSRGQPEEPPPRKPGRPFALDPARDPKLIEQVRALGAIQATTKEACAVLRVSEPTFLKFVAPGADGHEPWTQGQHEGRASLRRMQFEIARGDPGKRIPPNAQMAIFLGKNYLGQRDRFDVAPVEPLDLRKLTSAELDELERLTRKAAPTSTDADESRAASPDGDQGREESTRH